MKYDTTLIRKYFAENNFVQSNIESFNQFIEWKLQKLIDEIGDAVPAVIPPEAEEVKFRFGKISVEKPSIVEADGAKRKILPVEARMRDLTYAAPVYLEVSLIIDGKERERAEIEVAQIPVMLKSRLCYLNNLSRDESIAAGEDPYDSGGYFIVNGTERLLVLLEDLAANNIFVSRERTGPVTHAAKVLSASSQYKIPHILERGKDGLYMISFASVKRLPLILLLKALGLQKDADVAQAISIPEMEEDLYINLLDSVEVKTIKQAQEVIAKDMNLALVPEQKEQRVNYIIDNFLLPHIGSKEADRENKVKFLAQMAKKLALYKAGKVRKDDKDHYMNKRVRMSGDLLEDLFRQNLKVFVSDMLYIFQRGVRRGKVLPLSAIVRTQLLTSKIKSAMATGNWTGNRQGVSQRLERDNPLATLSHLQRVASLLEATRESFEARALHPTHWGRLCILESPEGKHIGLRKNLALLARITPELNPEEFNKNVEALKELGLGQEGQNVVFIDGIPRGRVKEAAVFVKEVIDARRAGKISKHLNILNKPKEALVMIALEKNRVIRPVIIVQNSKSLLTQEVKDKLLSGEMNWQSLIDNGIIEYIDALEEESLLVALAEEKIKKNNTHVEINPIAIFGMCTSMVPYANFGPSSRLNRGQKTQKQAMGCYTMNYLNRMDTSVNLLHYPQKPIVSAFTNNIFGEDRSSGQNIVVAIMNFDGYNMKDALVINRASIDRGVGRSTYYRPYTTEKLRYAGGQIDEIRIPDKEVQGYTVEKDYRGLTEDGIITPEYDVLGGDVLIGKTSPPRFLGKLEAFSTVANVRKDTSVRVRYGEGGVVNKVILTESEDGSALIKMDIRDTRTPEIGDKFSSRHGQKGVIGRIVPVQDMPFSASGIVPDVIFSPNGLSKRMTVNYLLEALGGKVGALGGRIVNATPFQSESADSLRKALLELGFRDDGTETLYDGRTGEEYPARIFVGSLYYLRLKYQVADKIQARARGLVALLTRQPTEGKAKEGGLRLGEMEKDTFVAHGASLLLKERFDSDREVVWVCERCGNLAIYDSYKNKAYCLCGEKAKVEPVDISYAFKLFLDELKSMHIRPRIILKDKY